MKENIIVLSRRSNDYHAQIKGNPKIWGIGRTPDEAIGNLIRCYPVDFGIELIAEFWDKNHLRKPLVTDSELILLGFVNDKEIQATKQKIFEMQLNGQIATFDEGIAMAVQILKTKEVDL